MSGAAAAGGAAAAFSVRTCDEYLAHLVEVGAQHQVVVATEDVCNEFGVVLLRAGTPLGAYALDRMRDHRLLNPVDQAFALRRRLAPEDLLDCFGESIGGEADLARIHARLAFEPQLRHLCLTTPWPAPLLQKLTVLRLRLPKVFHRALFAAWLAALIARERRLPDEDIALAFRAGLLQDLGLLHIPEALADKRAGITPAEWELIRGHAETSACILAQSGIDDSRLERVVREHHERHDGAGYPYGRVGADLDPMSALIALADMLYALRFPGVLSTGDIAEHLPYLKVNRFAFGTANYAPAARILLQGREHSVAPAAIAHAVPVQGLIDANHSLTTLLAAFREARPMLEAASASRTARSLATLVEQIQWIARSSGLGNEALEKWLAEALAAGRDEPAIAEVHATAQEVFWLVRRCDRLLAELLRETEGQETAISVKDLSMRVGSELTRAWRRFEASARG